MGLWLMNLPKIDVHDPEAVQERLNDYFGYMASQDAKPTVAGMAMAPILHKPIIDSHH